MQLHQALSSRAAAIRRYNCCSKSGASWGARSSRAACRAAAPSASQFEWQFEHSATNTKVHIFGVDHNSVEDHIGRFIIAEKPDAVIVETACNAAHGSVPGNLISCADFIYGDDGFFQRMFCALATKLQIQGDEAFAPGGLWEQVRVTNKPLNLHELASHADAMGDTGCLRSLLAVLRVSGGTCGSSCQASCPAICWLPGPAAMPLLLGLQVTQAAKHQSAATHLPMLLVPPCRPLLQP
jgi:hypothetical protein